MNWITISVALTVLACISFDHGYADTPLQDSNHTNETTQPPSPNQNTDPTYASGPSHAPAGPHASTAVPSGNGNGGSGAGELSAKVLMIATMAGCTLAVYGGL